MPAGGGTVKSRQQALVKVKAHFRQPPTPKPVVPQKPGYNVPVRGQQQRIKAGRAYQNVQALKRQQSRSIANILNPSSASPDSSNVPISETRAAAHGLIQPTGPGKTPTRGFGVYRDRYGNLQASQPR